MFKIAKKKKQPDSQPNPPADYDGAWKDAWKQHFRPFLRVYFPNIAKLVDWNCPPIWLDKEIEKIISHTGKAFTKPAIQPMM